MWQPCELLYTCYSYMWDPVRPCFWCEARYSGLRSPRFGCASHHNPPMMGQYVTRHIAAVHTGCFSLFARQLAQSMCLPAIGICVHCAHTAAIRDACVTARWRYFGAPLHTVSKGLCPLISASELGRPRNEPAIFGSILWILFRLLYGLRNIAF